MRTNTLVSGVSVPFVLVLTLASLAMGDVIPQSILNPEALENAAQPPMEACSSEVRANPSLHMVRCREQALGNPVSWQSSIFFPHRILLILSANALRPHVNILRHPAVNPNTTPKPKAS